MRISTTVIGLVAETAAETAAHLIHFRPFVRFGGNEGISGQNRSPLAVRLAHARQGRRTEKSLVAGIFHAGETQ